MHLGNTIQCLISLKRNRPPDGPPVCTPWGQPTNPAPQGKSLLGPPDPSCIPCPLGALQLSETPFPHPGGPDPSLSQLRTPGREGDNRGALASAAGFPGGSEGRESACNQEIWDRSLGREDPPGERNPLHYHVLENSRTVSFMGSQSQTCLSGLCVSAARLISRSSLWRPGSLRHDTEDLWICLRKVTS